MLDYFEKMSKEYDISLLNVLSISLNRYGILTDEIKDSRIRFNLKMLDNSTSRYFAVCVNTYETSPFALKNNKLLLNGNIIGEISKIEKDTCTSTYFRNDKKAITFNSNSRSKCVGCKFCGTYSLSDEDGFDFSNKENIIDYFNHLMRTNDMLSMKDIKDVTICTGCFKTEDDLIKHLILVNEAFKDLSFNGNINYIGSQLKDYNKIEILSKEIDNFGLFLTMEKFLDREKFMRPEKASLSLESAKDLLSYASSLDITTTFLYILGLEDIETVKKYFSYFKDSINKFPIIQVFQNYTKNQEFYRCEEAKNIEYYLKARKMIEEIYSDSSLCPESWECFRSLYLDEAKGLIKCKKN